MKPATRDLALAGNNGVRISGLLNITESQHCVPQCPQTRLRLPVRKLDVNTCILPPEKTPVLSSYWGGGRRECLVQVRPYPHETHGNLDGDLLAPTRATRRREIETEACKIATESS
ncbi:hypothetical protein RRG08_029035 [Elysia crispata]|uniref:Uncharacterized protein n=1 Tax=Elysia crispata TaxID=231223 RepID=A0AAE1AHV4_9GAST|nr:hypothetical protein RRG08_029035 [Elysia crispata]